jgi:hypothetical protein
MERASLASSRELGRYVGPVVVLLLVSELINFRIWEGGNPPQMNYLNGFVLLLFGFFIIHRHNVWVYRWPVWITLTGWFFAMLGLYRMFFPAAQQASAGTPMYLGLAVLIIIESYVTFRSYR